MLRVALALEDVEVVAVNDPFIDPVYMVTGSVFWQVVATPDRTLQTWNAAGCYVLMCLILHSISY